MLTVTESARAELKRVSSQVQDQPDSVLRLVGDELGQLSLVADVEKEGDQVIKHEETTVLVIDEQLSAALEGVGVDCQDTEAGPRLVLFKNQPEETEGQE